MLGNAQSYKAEPWLSKNGLFLEGIQLRPEVNENYLLNYSLIAF